MSAEDQTTAHIPEFECDGHYGFGSLTVSFYRDDDYLTIEVDDPNVSWASAKVYVNTGEASRLRDWLKEALR